jgi:hypothetical protein
MNQARRDMGIFRRAPRKAPAMQDSLTGSTATDQAVGSHPVADVKGFAAGHVSFSDTVLTDRGSFKSQQQATAAAGPPAGPEENGVRNCYGTARLCMFLCIQKQAMRNAYRAVLGLCCCRKQWTSTVCSLGRITACASLAVQASFTCNNAGRSVPHLALMPEAIAE